MKEEKRMKNNWQKVQLETKTQSWAPWNSGSSQRDYKRFSSVHYGCTLNVLDQEVRAEEQVSQIKEGLLCRPWDTLKKKRDSE